MLHSVTGRDVPDPPAIRLDSNRKTLNDLRKHDAWLIGQARLEAAGDEYVSLLLSRMEPGKLSQGDKDLAHQFLFGSTENQCQN